MNNLPEQRTDRVFQHDTRPPVASQAAARFADPHHRRMYDSQKSLGGFPEPTAPNFGLIGLLSIQHAELDEFSSSLPQPRDIAVRRSAPPWRPPGTGPRD